MKIKDRIKELRRVKASELVPNPKNWRTHPTKQKDALKGVLSEIGYADALLARELPDGSLMLLDGHLRAETTPEQEVPVLVLDLNEEESDKLLATLDPLASLAEQDDEKLAELLESIETENEALQELLNDLAGEGEEELILPRSGSNAITVEIDKLKWAGRTVTISQEEVQKLNEKYDEYLEENRVEFGFVNWIFEK